MHGDDDDARDRKVERSLDRIARTLNVPVESFYRPEETRSPADPEDAAPAEDVAQALTVMRLFLRLKDPEARARCIAFIARELTLDG